LFQGLVMTEEQPPITVKGFPKPISGYKLVGTYDDLVKDGKVVLEERDVCTCWSTLQSRTGPT
jgi:hypothetical protein